jgi:hypothetical protein
MTARDVIAEVVGEFMSAAERACRENVECADMILIHLLSAPESVRLELAKQLLPDMKSYAQFKEEERKKAAPASPSEDKTMSDNLDQETLDQLHAALKEAKATHISIPIGQHGALMAAAKALEMLCNKGDTVSLDDWIEAEDILAALRAAGIDLEEKRSEL